MAISNWSGPIATETGVIAEVENVANVSLPLTAKGTGVVANTQSLPYFKVTVATVDTTAAVTYTAAQIKGGLILRDPNGSGRSDLFPTAADIVAALPSAFVDQAFVVTIRNTADAAETITMTTNTGLTLSGTMTIAQSNQKSFLVRLTNVTSGAAAVTIYSMGTVVF
jgi:hypothetical protein